MRPNDDVGRTHYVGDGCPGGHQSEPTPDETPSNGRGRNDDIC